MRLGKMALALLALGAEGIEQLLVVWLGAFVQDARIDCRGHQVVRSRNRVNVAGQMQVEVLHWDHLRVAAARRAALDAEGGTLRGLADAGEDRLAQMRAERLRQADGCRSLAFAQGCRGDG